MKLIIQIPCYNEEKTLAFTLKQIPRSIPGIDTVELLIINDGSTDRTVEVAKANGVAHVVDFPKNKGLAKGFMAGIERCLTEGADIIVNTDADNQYNAADIPKLIQPILDGTAEFVVGARPISNIRHFSPIKKALQKIGSYVVRKISQTDIPDAPSGFRAISRDAAMRLNVHSRYTYTLETIIQAGLNDIAITSVPIRVNEELRPSRLVRSTWSYIKRSIFTMLRIFVVYKPFRFFMSIGIFVFLLGTIFGLRFLYFFFTGNGTGHVQSLILTAILLMMGFQTMLVAFLSDLLATNRRLLEDIRYRQQKDQAV
jgi:glycosyltransferase involved in cell wall biosynthesis